MLLNNITTRVIALKLRNPCIKPSKTILYAHLNGIVTALLFLEDVC